MSVPIWRIHFDGFWQIYTCVISIAFKAQEIPIIS